MSVLGTVARLEYSRQRFWSPFAQPRSFYGVVAVLFIAGFICGVRGASITVLTMGAAYLSVISAFCLSVGVFWSLLTDERMWFLGLPQPRRTLILGKWMAAFLVSLRSFCLIWGTYLLLLALLLLVMHGHFMLMPMDVLRALCWMLFSFCTMVAATALGTYTPLICRGWWYIVWVAIWPAVWLWWLPACWFSPVNLPNQLSLASLMLAALLMVGIAALLLLVQAQFGTAVLRRAGRPRENVRGDRLPAARQTVRLRRISRIQQIRKSSFASVFWLAYIAFLSCWC